MVLLTFSESKKTRQFSSGFFVRQSLNQRTSGSNHFRNIKELAVFMEELVENQWLERQFFKYFQNQGSIPNSGFFFFPPPPLLGKWVCTRVDNLQQLLITAQHWFKPLLGGSHWDLGSQTSSHNENQMVSHLVMTNLRARLMVLT